MQIRILHITKEEPWVSNRVLIDSFGCQNQALQKIDRLMINNALSLIENVGWRVGKSIEYKDRVSLLFIKTHIEDEEYI